MASDNYYDEGGEESNTAVADRAKDSGESDSATGLLPKSVFMGKDVEVGETLSFKVTAIHDDEVQVQCIKGDSENKEESDEPEAQDNPTEEAAEPEPEPGDSETSPQDSGGGMYE